MNKSENINELAASLSKMQSQLHGARKDAKNPFFNANYADLESIWESIRKPLTDNGLAIAQVGGFEGDKYTLITILTHSSGQWISGAMTINPVKQDPQSLGSALTYMRRYGVAAIIGQVQVDDDGNGASQQPIKKPVTKPTPPKEPINKEAQVKPAPGQLFENLEVPGYVVDFGKFKGRQLKDIDVGELTNYMEFIERSAKENNKPITGDVLQFMECAEFYLKSLDK